MSSVQERVQEVMTEQLGMDEIGNDFNLKENLDSLDITECAMELEEEFNINIPDESWSLAETYLDVVNLVAHRLLS